MLKHLKIKKYLNRINNFKIQKLLQKMSFFKLHYFFFNNDMILLLTF